MPLIFAILIFILQSTTASAHAFGQRYDLPLPLWMFITAGAFAVVLSFVVIVTFMRHKPEPGVYPTFNLLNNPMGRFLAAKTTLAVIRIFFFLIFLLTIATGFFGTPSPYQNFSVVMLWVIAWVGMAFVCSLLGNFWALINPWNTAFAWAEALYGKFRPGRQLSRGEEFPSSWGTWPAFIFFFIFAWMEITWPGSGVPSNIATALSVYSVLTWLGMYFFGREIWLKNGEAFSVAYALFARFAITEVRVIDGEAAADCQFYDIKTEDAGCINGYSAFDRAGAADREWNLRPLGVGLGVGEPPSFTMVFFVLLLLSTVTFDGYTETQQFQDLGLLLFKKIQGLGQIAIMVVETTGLTSFPILFIIAYFIFMMLIGGASGARGGAKSFAIIAPLFIFSIIPIAIAYHLSHYLSLILSEGQVIIARFSDPFGFGWDLFGTAGYKVDLTIVTTKFIWYFSIVFIVIGHIVAVYLAHVEAVRHFDTRRQALMSQAPMLGLMVGYTMVSLWIIAQPIVS